MLAEGVTINEGEDCPVGLCAALVCANNKIAGRVNKPIDAIWPVVIIAHLRRRLELISPSASIPGRLLAKASWSMSLASRTTKLRSPHTALPENAGPALLSPCGRARK